MAIVRLQEAFGRVVLQRCCHRFVSIAVLIAIAPRVTHTLHGRMVMQVVQALVLVAALAALGSSPDLRE